MNLRRIILSAAMGACLFSTAANATDYGNRHMITISGGTLFKTFFSAPAGTNDWIDVDQDGLFGFDPYNYSLPDQLAMAWDSTDAQNRWIVTSRGVGSGTGLKDLINWWNAMPVAGTNFIVPNDASYVSRTAYCDSTGAFVGPYNAANPGNAPLALPSVDIAVMDVPTRWLVKGPTATPNWHAAPMTAGYGQNAIPTWDSSAQSSQLGSLTSAVSGITYNYNMAFPNAQTIFDTEIAWVPIAVCANQGTGLQNVTEAELRHMYITGRTARGENLAVATREQGSGTKNGGMNSLGMDPSWARGDNYGAKTTSNTNTAYLGTAAQVSNLGATGRMQDVLRNRRLAVGYVGLQGTADVDATSGLYEILNVQKSGGTSYVRPSRTNIVNNSDINNGWRIGGNETMATVGDPNRLHPYAMANGYASDYLMNISESIKAFADPSGVAEQSNMPGQYLATKYVLRSGVEYMPLDSDPSTFVSNPGFIQSVNDYIRANNTLSVPSFGISNGKVPARAQLGTGTYSDGRTYIGTDDYYTDSHNQQIRTSSTLSKRNKIMGDFYYDGQRNTLDINAMMAAYADPRNFELNNNNGGDGYVIVELIGDYNGDGNFDDKDIRYFADGLAMDPVTGKLNRAAGFEAVDKAWTVGTTGHPAGNFFNVALATSLNRAYQLNSGWSKADIAGAILDNSKTPAGAAPMGSDGKIDSKDIDYINYILRGGMKYKALGQTPPVNYNVRSNRLVWSNLDDAAVMDLSADLNGDLVVDKEDLDVLVKDILGTNYGDVNLDGFVNATDRAIIAANISTTYGKTWAQGDIDGDGYVTQNDLNLFDGVSGCGADINCDHFVDFKDFAQLADHWLQAM